jgi:hypothetical protein
VDRPDWAPPSVDLHRPSAARVYDYFLGGAHNFAVDRAAAEATAAVMPALRATLRANRAFLWRAVRFLTDTGVRQFLDIGSGIPTVGNVHEIAQRTAPHARVVYVDIDPVAVAHSQAILAGNPNTSVVQADLRQPHAILNAGPVRHLIDLDQPIAVLLLSMLHFLTDADDPAGKVAALREACPPGSYLAISHATQDGQPPEVMQAQTIWNTRSPNPVTFRTHPQISALFADWTLLPPGLVHVPLWRPDPDDDTEHPERFNTYAGIARKDEPRAPGEL